MSGTIQSEENAQSERLSPRAPYHSAFSGFGGTDMTTSVERPHDQLLQLQASQTSQTMGEQNTSDAHYRRNGSSSRHYRQYYRRRLQPLLSPGFYHCCKTLSLRTTQALQTSSVPSTSNMVYPISLFLSSLSSPGQLISHYRYHLQARFVWRDVTVRMTPLIII